MVSMIRAHVVDSKINDLDKQLRVCKEQLKKASGPTAANIKKRAMDLLKRKVNYNYHTK